MFAKLIALKNHQGFMKYFKNTSWLLAEKILRMLVGLFIGVWIARYLEPTQFGLLSYAMSFVGLFLAFATLGLDGIVVREFLNNDSKENELLSTVFILKLFGSLLVLTLLEIAINLTENDGLTNTLIFIIASATIFQSFNTIDFYFQSTVQSKYVVFSSIIMLLLSSTVKISLILFKAPLISFAWVILFESSILALGLIYFFLNKSGVKFSFKYNNQIAIGLLKDSWPLILSGLVISIYMKIDQIMIKEMLGLEQVGQYAAAVQLSQAWYFIPMIVSSSLFPAILNAKKNSEELYKQRLQKLYDLMVISSLVIAVPTIFLSDFIIDLLYGDKYEQAGTVLAIHIGASIFVFLGVASSKWFIAENLQLYSFYRTLAGLIINITLNYVLIPLYSIYGAAVATLISQAVAAYLFNITNTLPLAKYNTFLSYRRSQARLLMMA